MNASCASASASSSGMPSFAAQRKSEGSSDR